MAKKPEPSRVPQAVGPIPLLGDMVRNADAQARWMQDLLEQNARLIGQLPDTMKSFNDTLERFNQTVARLDRAVTQMENASKRLLGPIERVLDALDRLPLRELPETLDALRRETIPALRAAADTQATVANLQSAVERLFELGANLPGAGILRRLANRDDPVEDGEVGDGEVEDGEDGETAPPRSPSRRKTAGKPG